MKKKKKNKKKKKKKKSRLQYVPYFSLLQMNNSLLSDHRLAHQKPHLQVSVIALRPDTI